MPRAPRQPQTAAPSLPETPRTSRPRCDEPPPGAGLAPRLPAALHGIRISRDKERAGPGARAGENGRFLPCLGEQINNGDAGDLPRSGFINQRALGKAGTADSSRQADRTLKLVGRHVREEGGLKVVLPPKYRGGWRLTLNSLHP